MIDVDGLIGRITASFEEFEAVCEKATTALLELARVLQSPPMRPLTVPGRWAYTLGTWLGFGRLDVLAWLETCPGAFEDEFQEEHWS